MKPTLSLQVNALELKLGKDVMAQLFNSNFECTLWSLARNSNVKYTKVTCAVVVNAIAQFTSRQFTRICPKCGLHTSDIVEHKLCHCHALNSERSLFWDALIAIHGYRGFANFVKRSSHEQCHEVLALVVENDLESFNRSELVYVVQLLL